MATNAGENDRNTVGKMFAMQEETIKHLRRLLHEKEEEIVELRSQVDKYKSIISYGSSPVHRHLDAFGVPITRPISPKVAGPRKTRLMGISAEPQSLMTIQELINTKFPEFQKSDKSRELITNALLDNDFMKNLEMIQIKEITDCMYPIEYPNGALIIKENDVGSVLYIMEEGKIEVSKEGKLLHKMGPGKVFGELAILYNCTRTASVKAIMHCKLWAIDRQCFQTIMMRTGLIRQKEYMEFLKTVPLFRKIADENIVKIVDVLEE
ncbi:cGMP-dependent protein kinase: isozyme 2 forms cD4/T1/T3A/T3B-like protein, partial [Leptotrombidium deliense]